MDDEKLTIKDLLDQIPEPKIKTPTKLCLSYEPDSEGRCFFWHERCDAITYSKASVSNLGEDYFCPHMPAFHKNKRKALIEKEVSKKYWTEYWKKKLEES